MTMLNRSTAVAAGLFAAGIALVLLSIFRGEGSAGIVVCVPFFFGNGLLASLGVVCFIGGMVMLLLGIARAAAAQAARQRREPAEETDGQARTQAGNATKTRAGGVILLGPIPIVFGSDPGMSRTMFYLASGLITAFIVVLVILALL